EPVQALDRRRQARRRHGGDRRNSGGSPAPRPRPPRRNPHYLHRGQAAAPPAGRPPRCPRPPNARARGGPLRPHAAHLDMATGARDRAQAESGAFDAARTKVPPDSILNLNRTDDVFGVARGVLDARLAAANGDREAAVAAWRRAVEHQDALAYDEPPAWYYPV